MVWMGECCGVRIEGKRMPDRWQELKRLDDIWQEHEATIHRSLSPDSYHDVISWSCDQLLLRLVAWGWFVMWWQRKHNWYSKCAKKWGECKYGVGFVTHSQFLIPLFPWSPLHITLFSSNMLRYMTAFHTQNIPNIWCLLPLPKHIPASLYPRIPHCMEFQDCLYISWY